jgi:protein involved in polysaccharide export with SLBB domain
VWGEVSIDGEHGARDIAALEKAIEKRLMRDYVHSAHVTVSILQANKLLVYLLGRGGMTSGYRLDVGGTLSELLVRARIAPETCKRRMAVIIRREAPGAASSEAGIGPAIPVPVTATVDLYDLMIKGRKEIDIPLQRDDWVRLVRRDPEHNEAYVFLIGDERTQTGAVKYQENMTVADVLKQRLRADDSRKSADDAAPPTAGDALASYAEGENKAAADRKTANEGDAGNALDDSKKRTVEPNQFLLLGDWPAAEGQVAVFGDVANAGVQKLENAPTLGDAVAAAQPTRDAGSLTRIVLARRPTESPEREGRDSPKPHTLSFFFKNRSQEDGYGLARPLEAGDVIFVIGDADRGLFAEHGSPGE